MKKKSLFLIALIMVGFFLIGCDVGFGSKHVKNPKEYGKWESYLDIPAFLPNSITNYQVNDYSYTLLAYMDICYEIFLDVSVMEEQFEELISNAKSQKAYLREKEAYYCEGYYEIVFQNYYEVYDGKDFEGNVGWADIEKIVYNPETLNIIFVCFHANDTGVYELDDVAYFNRFSITQQEYVANLK